MKNEKLMRAMSEIDEDLILEAHAERRVIPFWTRLGAIAACLLLVVLLVPQMLQNGGVDVFPTAKDEVEMDAEMNSPEIPDKSESYNGAAEDVTLESSVQNPAEMEKDDGSFVYGDLLLEIRESRIQTALSEQGNAYSLGTTVENEYGKVTFTDRSKSTVTMKVSLRKDFTLSVFSATSGTWRLTVNGEAAEKFPDKAGEYEIVIDFSNDKSLELIYAVDFGVFSIGAE